MEKMIEIKKNSFRSWLLASRPKTLIGAAVPVMIGTAFALTDSHFNIQLVPTILCFLFAFVMQIDANFVNDYFDFIKGNDDNTRLGPERACAKGWIEAKVMKRALVYTTLIGCLIGLPLVYWGGLTMILIGLLCVVFCFLYTTYLSYRGMGDLLVLVFFGIVPVCLTYYLAMPADMPKFTWEVFVSSLMCGMVIDTLLIVNNYRDIDNDRRVGKNTLVVKLGAELSRWLYLMIGIIACTSGIIFIIRGHYLPFALPLIYLILHVRTYKRMVEIDKGKELNLILGETARNIFIYGLLLSAGIILSYFIA